MTPERLTIDLRRACIAAEEAIKGMADGGTCCLDSVFIPVGKAYPLKRRSRFFEKAIEDAGLTFFSSKSKWWNGYLIYPSTGGQAATRLQACESMTKTLSDLGWQAVTYYQMD